MLESCSLPCVALNKFSLVWYLDTEKRLGFRWVLVAFVIQRIFFFVRCVLGALKYQHKTRNQHGDKSWGWGWVGAFSMSIADPYQTCWARPFQIPGSSDAEISHAWELSLNSWWDNEQGLFSFLARSHQLCPPLNLSHFRSKSAGLNHLFPDFVPWEPLPELLVFPRHMILKQEHIASQGWVRGCSSQL